MSLLKALDALRREEPFEGFCETLVALEQNSADAQKLSICCSAHAPRRNKSKRQTLPIKA